MANSFDKRKAELQTFKDALEDLNIKTKEEKVNPKSIPDGLVLKCPSCQKVAMKEDWENTLHCCPNCGYHLRLTPKQRLDMVLDEGYEIILTDLKENYLEFPSYVEKLEKAKADTGDDESIVCAKGYIDGVKCFVGVMNSFFMMGSMGSVTGEKVTRIAEFALKEGAPLILFTCSGGARMQEGIISLMQMAKTSEAIGRLREKELFISVLTDPTTGGVSASFASLADITLAEPKALIGFAGKRVIERTIKETLPKEFQTAEFLLEKGYIDRIVPRKFMKKDLSFLLKAHGYR